MKKSILCDGKYIPYYRYLVEQKIGRKLTTNDAVHHINCDHEDNRIENLQLMTRSDHAVLHGKQHKGREDEGNFNKILLRIDDEFKKEIEALAKRNKRSLNSEILMAIYDYIKNNEDLLK